MAAAEARAAWQRTANRYFVQEDAKRAPKLACCPPSSSSSKPQVDTGNNDTLNGSEHTAAGFMPLNWNPSSSNLPPDTKWWLQLQPNYGHQKELTYEQLNVLETELESLRSEEMMRTSNLSRGSSASEKPTPLVESNNEVGCSLDPLCRVSTTCTKNDLESTKQVLKAAAKGSNIQHALQHKDMGDYWCKSEGLMDMEPINQFVSKEPERLFDPNSRIVGEKTEPWWLTADKDELASLVAKKSLEHIENCDLPPPQTMHIRRGPFTCPGSMTKDGVFASLDQKAPSGICNSTDHSSDCPTSTSVNGKQWNSIQKGQLESEKTFRSSSTDSKDPKEVVDTSEGEPTKAQLMEALRHSQTRAREAEEAAQQAYNEKEHILRLFFRQASHLFAYKQWLQLLQVETIGVQLKNKDQPISTLFPAVLPWMPYKGRQWKRGKHKTKKARHGPRRNGISRYAVAFAVGLGLVGAGLLLGWTMGWLMPVF